MLTRSQFEIACKAFIATHSTVVPHSPAAEALQGWSWNEHPSVPGLGFMSRTAIHYWRTRSISTDPLPIADDLEEAFSEEDEASTTSASETLRSQQYVVYSATFQVPAFYFTVHDSQGIPLSLSDLVRTSLFHPFAFEQTNSTTFGLTRPSSSFPLLSQGDHPILGTPSWYLHPCETATSVNEIMAELHRDDWSEEQRLVRWLETWFMIVGTAVNCRL
ncbi:Ubiquitin-like-conjugating enzyme ATG10 [Hypsizygus marmoreus]|uniref:Ubiquitin-like-conjugating enzyme ATG10 n=1 Tax=Hypsizygus marmoreus TaxID=39966 RepID=A0A369JPL0_HYPMA|nr:Ubiquitin-like-conjugating enzyme ATG10 [Hypsizygus marmoreus]